MPLPRSEFPSPQFCDPLSAYARKLKLRGRLSIYLVKRLPALGRWHNTWLKRSLRLKMKKIRKIGVCFAQLAILAGVSFMAQASVEMPGAQLGPLSVMADSAYPILQVQPAGEIQLAARMVVRRSAKFRGRRGAKRRSSGGNTNSQVRAGASRSHANFTKHLAPKSSAPQTTTSNPLPLTIRSYSPHQPQNSGAKKGQAKPGKVKGRSHKRRGRVGNRRHRSHRHGHRHR